jgi:hypothetical protein
MFKNGALKGKWDKWAENFGGGITQKWDIIDRIGCNVERGRRGKGNNSGI